MKREEKRSTFTYMVYLCIQFQHVPLTYVIKKKSFERCKVSFIMVEQRLVVSYGGNLCVASVSRETTERKYSLPKTEMK